LVSALWLRWGDALLEAGCAPNKFQTKIDDAVLIEKYIGLIRELGRFPIEGEIRRKARTDATFPNHGVFARFGGKEKLRERVSAHCRERLEFHDVLVLCVTHGHSGIVTGTTKRNEKIATGFVYLMKSGVHYKIGRTNSLGRRESELAIKIPVPPTTIHSIETDDPVGVEAYWHRRFADKRGLSDHFQLRGMIDGGQ